MQWRAWGIYFSSTCLTEPYQKTHAAGMLMASVNLRYPSVNTLQNNEGKIQLSNKRLIFSWSLSLFIDMKVLCTTHFLWIWLLMSFCTFLHPVCFIILGAKTRLHSIYLKESWFLWQKRICFMDFFPFSALCERILYNFSYF